MTKEEAINTIIAGGCETNKISDGYHTFEELYEFRKVYNAALFNEWAKQNNQYTDLPIHDVHKSWKHNDGELCFGGGWFIVVAILPTGQISNHYEAKDWDLFKVPEVAYKLNPNINYETRKRISRKVFRSDT